MKNILFVIETPIQFESIFPLIGHIKKEAQVEFEIFVPNDTFSDDRRFQKDFDKTAELIGKKKLTVHYRSYPKKSYQIAVMPFMWRRYYDNIQAKYFIKYRYSISIGLNKASWNVPRWMNDDYRADAIIANEAKHLPLLNVVTSAYYAPNLKMINPKAKKHHNTKPIVLLMPSYDEVAFTKKLIAHIQKIKNKYQVAVRGHHLTTNGSGSEKDVLLELCQVADIVFDSNLYSVQDTLKEVDVIVTDNSGSIFDGIYCGIPVVLFSEDPNKFSYREINTIQYDLIEHGDILWTNDPKNMMEIIGRTLGPSIIKKQKEIRKDLFPQVTNEPVNAWMDVLNIYLNDTLPYQYHLIKKYWIEQIDTLAEGGAAKQDYIKSIEAENDRLHNELASHLGVKRSIRLLVGNIGRRIKDIRTTKM